MRELERALAAFGQGYAWHLDGFPTWQALLGGVRAACAADAHRPGTSPLTPEGAVVLAGRLSSTLEGGARVLVVDSDPRLADALIGLGHTVTAWVPPANMPLWAGGWPWCCTPSSESTAASNCRACRPCVRRVTMSARRASSLATVATG